MGSWLVDTHAHIDLIEETPESVIADCRRAGVHRIITVGIDLPSCRLAVKLADRFEEVYAAVGIHPHDADSVTPATMGALRELASLPKVVAVGETGLDFYRNYADRGNQERLFHEQLALAARVGKPVVIHDREAHEVLLAILRAHEGELTGGVMHCFSGDRSFMEKVLPLGFAVSIPGTVTFTKPNGALAEVVRACPADRILVETDCPWLAPVPHRGRRNEPAYVRFTVERVAEIRKWTFEEADRATSENARRVFRMEEAP
jgi:TatD DNase family protein